MTVNHPGTRLNIMMADDDIDDRYFFEKALNEIPFPTQLITVNNGEQLMEHLLEESNQLPDVLFLDLSMPRKTGFECLHEIKDNIKLKGLTVIMLTTSFTRGIELEDNLRNTLIRMGASDYIRKPVGFDILKQVIQQALVNLPVKPYQ